MSEKTQRVSTKAVAIGIAVVALILAGIVSFYAASTPDGLTKVSQDQGFADTETDHASSDSPFAGYGSSFISDDRISGGVAGVVGVVVVLGLAGGATFVLRRRSTDEASDEQATSSDQTTV